MNYSKVLYPSSRKVPRPMTFSHWKTTNLYPNADLHLNFRLVISLGLISEKYIHVRMLFMNIFLKDLSVVY
jgi:hypothetical protein